MTTSTNPPIASSGGPCCTHLTVRWTTFTEGGRTRGWWECKDCSHKFVPSGLKWDYRDEVINLLQAERDALVARLKEGDNAPQHPSPDSSPIGIRAAFERWSQEQGWEISGPEARMRWATWQGCWNQRTQPDTASALIEKLEAKQAALRMQNPSWYGVAGEMIAVVREHLSMGAAPLDFSGGKSTAAVAALSAMKATLAAMDGDCSGRVRSADSESSPSASEDQFRQPTKMVSPSEIPYLISNEDRLERELPAFMEAAKQFTENLTPEQAKAVLERCLPAGLGEPKPVISSQNVPAENQASAQVLESGGTRNNGYTSEQRGHEMQESGAQQPVELPACPQCHKPAIGEGHSYTGGSFYHCICGHRWGASPVRESGWGEWIDWGGGNCPVDQYAIVEVELRDTPVPFVGYGVTWHWHHSLGKGDILRYRVLDEQGRKASDA